MLERNETGTYGTAHPRQLFYYFNGVRVGDVGNEGATNFSYGAAIAMRDAAAPTGPVNFQAKAFADFQQAYEPINPTSQGTADSVITVSQGDTLQSIAAGVWGDATLWYLIAEANGLNGSETLVAGSTLKIPAKVVNLHNNSSTFRVYDPNLATGDTQPNQAKPPAKPDEGCGMMGLIIVMIVAAVVAYFVGEWVYNVIMPYMMGNTTAALVIAGAVGGIAGSVAGQGVGMAIEVQDEFSWNAVALAGVSGAVGGLFGKVIPGNSFVAGAARGAAGSVVTQGVAVATGLQREFSWTDVAVGAVVGGVSSWVAGNMESMAINDAMAAQGGNEALRGAVTRGVQSGPFGVGGAINSAASGVAGGLAGAGARSLLEGSNFGDNLMAVLPSVIGSTIGNAVAGQMKSQMAVSRQDMTGLGRDLANAGEEIDQALAVATGAHGASQSRASATTAYGTPRIRGAVAIDLQSDSDLKVYWEQPEGYRLAGPLGVIDEALRNAPVIGGLYSTLRGYRPGTTQAATASSLWPMDLGEVDPVLIFGNLVNQAQETADQVGRSLTQVLAPDRQTVSDNYARRFNMDPNASKFHRSDDIQSRVDLHRKQAEFAVVRNAWSQGHVDAARANPVKYAGDAYVGTGKGVAIGGVESGNGLLAMASFRQDFNTLINAGAVGTNLVLGKLGLDPVFRIGGNPLAPGNVSFVTPDILKPSNAIQGDFVWGGRYIELIAETATGGGALSRTSMLAKAETAGYRPLVLADEVVPAVETASGIKANKLAGDAMRDVIAAREAPALTEQPFTTVGGVRRVDILKLGEELPFSIESKVGRTPLGSRERQELARDWWLVRQGQVSGVRWEFSPSGVNGGVGPTPALQQKLDKLGFETRINP